MTGVANLRFDGAVTKSRRQPDAHRASLAPSPHPQETEAMKPKPATEVEPACSNCRFYNPRAAANTSYLTSAGPQGSCRAHPEPVIKDGFEWCGEYSRKSP